MRCKTCRTVVLEQPHNVATCEKLFPFDKYSMINMYFTIKNAPFVALFYLYPYIRESVTFF